MKKNISPFKIEVLSVIGVIRNKHLQLNVEKHLTKIRILSYHKHNMYI